MTRGGVPNGLQALFEAIEEGVAIQEMLYDEQGEIVDVIYRQVNTAFENQGGLRNAVDRSIFELLPGVEASWLDHYRQVAKTGEPIRVENYRQDVDRWFECSFSRIDEDGRFIATIFKDISDRKRAEIALSESEERQAFLLALGDALRAIPTAGEKIAAAARLLGERLVASRVLWAEYNWERKRAHIFGGWFAEGAQSFPTVMQLDAYDGEVLSALRAGETVRVDDIGLLVAEPAYAEIAAVGVQALLSVPLVIDGVLRVNVSIHQHDPRRWTDEEVALVREVAERLWAEVVRARAEDALRESEEKYRTLFGELGQGFCELELIRGADGRVSDLRYIFVNPAHERLAGIKAEEAVGRTTLELVPTFDPSNFALYDKAVNSGSRLRVEYEVPSLGRWYEVYIYPSSNDRVFVLYEDFTDRKRDEQALRESEERQRLTVELVPVLLWSTSSDGREVSLNERWLAYTGQSDADSEQGGWLAAVHPDDLPETRAAFEHAFATGEPLEREQRIHKAGDGWRWHLVRQVPVTDESGSITRWFGAAVDIHESKLAQQALEKAELRLQLLVEGVPQLVWRAVENGRWTWASPQWTSYTGQAEPDSHDHGWLEPVHPDDRDRVRAVWEGAIERGEFHVDYRICHQAESRYRWFQTRATPVRDQAGQIVEWLGTSTDVDDLRRLQERQQILLAELQHRVRNILAVTRSIISRSDDGERSTEDYVQHLQGRIATLARTQVLLTRSAGKSVDLEELIRDELIAQAADEGQITLSGEEIAISPKSAEVLTLAIHELATNATKYGAFSRPTGRLEVRWRSEPRNGQRWLVIEWRERGVSIVDAVPRRQGFGSELISRRIPYELKGHGNFTLQPGGLESRIEFPLVAGESILQTDAGAR